MTKNQCGGCGKRIWWWQPRREHSLRENPWRPAMDGVPFHIMCWAKMDDRAR